MSASTFNAITYANKLKNAGLKIEVADVQAEEMSNLINNDLATKRDLKDLEYRLTIKLGMMLFAWSSVMIGILKLTGI